jgi:thioredoxin-related protein
MSRLLCAMSFLLLPVVAQEKGDLWIQDFAKAKAQAKAEKKDLLIDFTGSDWCGWCIKLDEEVFGKDAFTGAAPKSFVLVKLDYPQDESRITPEIKKQNEGLQKQYQIQGFPTILLCDADGNVYGQTGYQEGGPEKYVEMLAEQKKKGDVFQAAMLRATDKKGMDRAKALDEALSGLDAEVVSSHHLARMEEIVTLDADGKGGLKEKYEAKVKEIAEAREIDAEAQAISEMISPLMEQQKGKEALEKLDAMAKAPKSKIQHQWALFFKGMVQMDVDGDAKAAIAALEAGKAVAPESPIGKRIDMILPNLRKQLEGKDEGGK